MAVTHDKKLLALIHGIYSPDEDYPSEGPFEPETVLFNTMPDLFADEDILYILDRPVHKINLVLSKKMAVRRLFNIDPAVTTEI